MINELFELRHEFIFLCTTGVDWGLDDSVLGSGALAYGESNESRGPRVWA